jgi:hypothetical protein
LAAAISAGRAITAAQCKWLKWARDKQSRIDWATNPGILKRTGSFAAAGAWLCRGLVDQICTARPDFFIRGPREPLPTIGPGTIARAIGCGGAPVFHRLFGRSEATAESSSCFSAFCDRFLSRLFILSVLRFVRVVMESRLPEPQSAHFNPISRRSRSSDFKVKANFPAVQ